MNSSGDSNRSRVLRRAEAPVVQLTPTDGYRFMTSGQAGQPEIFEEVGGRGDGPPLHRHPWASWELVLEGKVRFLIDGEQHELGPGDFVYTPRGASHCYRIESETARIVGINEAGGMLEKLQRAAAPLFHKPGPPDMQAIMRIATEHRVEVLGPPLPPSEG